MQTQPYEGNTFGKATFKVKKALLKPTPRATAENFTGRSKEQNGAMLTNEEIKDICETYNLSRGQVYNIRSTFGSMCEMSEKWILETFGAAQ